MITLKYINTEIISNTDNENSIVLIGAGNTNKYLNTPIQIQDKKNMNNIFGDSELTNAYNSCFDTCDNPNNIFVINCRRISDYILIIDLLVQYNFKYVVPIGINFSDKFYNSIDNKNISYVNFYLSNLGKNTNSCILMTDEHASKYEDIDDFLLDMNNKYNEICTNSYGSIIEYGRNMILVANNLKNDYFANASLAGSLLNSDFEYPIANFGEAVFDIDDFDMKIPMCFFHNNVLRETTVENLYNLRSDNDEAKMVTIDLILRYIERHIDFSKYKGKLFSTYILWKLNKEITDFLNKLIGNALLTYSILSINFVPDKNNTYSGTIIIRLNITPIFSTESFMIELEV